MKPEWMAKGHRYERTSDTSPDQPEGEKHSGLNDEGDADGIADRGNSRVEKRKL